MNTKYLERLERKLYKSEARLNEMDAYATDHPNSIKAMYYDTYRIPQLSLRRDALLATIVNLFPPTEGERIATRHKPQTPNTTPAFSSNFYTSVGHLEKLHRLQIRRGGFDMLGAIGSYLLASTVPENSERAEVAGVGLILVLVLAISDIIRSWHKSHLVYTTHIADSSLKFYREIGINKQQPDSQL